MTLTILLTGFEPFGGDSRNPSLDAVRLVEKSYSNESARLVVSVLPVEFTRMATKLRALISAHQPDLVICTGLAAGRSDISFERVAINLADARIPDNAGQQPVDVPLIADGENALFSNLPVKRAVRRLNALEIPASVSYSAGTYVCNAAMYHALSAVTETGAQAGFIHVPDAYSAHPSMSITEIARGLEVALDSFVESRVTGSGDATVPMGTEY